MFWLLEDEIKGYYKRKYLPHYDNDKVYQFITFRLYDSVPKSLLFKWRDELLLNNKFDKDSDNYVALERKIHVYEDSGYGACYLQNPLIYNLVKETFEIFDKERYELIEWVIMPNHVHLVIRPNPDFSLSKIVHSWKSYTANKANQILGRKGEFWMKDYFDRYIRNEEHFDRVIKYIIKNRESMK